MKKKKSLDRLLSELDASMMRPPPMRETVIKAATDTLNAYLDGKVASPIANLSTIATWLGHSGAYSVLHDDLSGWKRISASLQYRALDARALLAMLDKGTAKSIQAIDSIFVLLHAISCHEDDMATWFGNRLLRSVEQKDKRITGWTAIPLYPFTLALFARWKNMQLNYSPSVVCSIGLYQNVLDAWDDERMFAQALVAACDYHVQQAFDDSENDTQDFFMPLYTVFPVEILAIQRIRGEAGLSMPKIDHPLMQTGLATPPANMPSVEDELLRAVSAKVSKDFSLSDLWK